MEVKVDTPKGLVGAPTPTPTPTSTSTSTGDSRGKDPRFLQDNIDWKVHVTPGVPYHPHAYGRAVYNGYDMGVDNMGFASVEASPQGTRILWLDHRPLLLGSKKGVKMIAITKAIIQYAHEVHSPTIAATVGSPLDLEPTVSIIEQPFISMMGSGINLHVVEATAALASHILTRYPESTVTLKAPSAKAGWAKLRARAVAYAITSLHETVDRKWDKYLIGLKDPQHICDALTMVADSISFRGWERAKKIIEQWEKDNPMRKEKAMLPDPIVDSSFTIDPVDSGVSSSSISTADAQVGSGLVLGIRGCKTKGKGKGR